MSGEKLSISSATRPTRAVGLGLTLLLAGLELGALLGPREDWPFTSAPMFARHQDRRAPVYYLEWWVELDGERRLLSPQRDLGMGELPFRRGYFAAFYGSADARHPGGHFPHDDEAHFSSRQGDYCRRLAAAFRARPGAAPRFQLVVSEALEGQTTRSRAIGGCVGQRFRRAP